MKCSRCQHSYKPKFKLETADKWIRMLENHPKAKNISFMLDGEELYPYRLKKHDCQAGYWNNLGLMDSGDYGYPREKKSLKYLRDKFYDVYEDRNVDVCCHFSSHDFTFAGVKSVREEGTTLKIYLGRY